MNFCWKFEDLSLIDAFFGGQSEDCSFFGVQSEDCSFLVGILKI